MAILTPILLGQLHFIFLKIIVALDSSYFKTYNTIPSSSFYTVCCQRYSALKLLVTGGGHLEFSQDKWTEKIETVFSVLLRQYKWKTQSFKIYMKSYWAYICYIAAYNIHILRSFQRIFGWHSFILLFS